MSDTYPDFMKSLQKVVAPKSLLNVRRSMIDFVDFITELYGHEGPNKRKLLRPESVKLTLQKYANLHQSTSKEWVQTQPMVDFKDLPNKGELVLVKKVIIDLAKKLLDKGIYLKGLSKHEYDKLMKCLACIIVFRNGCLMSSATQVKFEHYRQLCRENEDGNYLMPLAPREAIWRKK